jgi:hypothetical protein
VSYSRVWGRNRTRLSRNIGSCGGYTVVAALPNQKPQGTEKKKGESHRQSASIRLSVTGADPHQGGGAIRGCASRRQSRWPRVQGSRRPCEIRKRLRIDPPPNLALGHEFKAVVVAPGFRHQDRQASHAHTLCQQTVAPAARTNGRSRSISHRSLPNARCLTVHPRRPPERSGPLWAPGGLWEPSTSRVWAWRACLMLVFPTPRRHAARDGLARCNAS